MHLANSYCSLAESFNSSYKLSPLTSTGTLTESQQKLILSQPLQIETQLPQPPTINKFISQNLTIDQQLSLQPLNRFQLIQKQIMQYFQQKGVQPGHPEEWKKQYQRKLHKATSMNSQVSQLIVQKALGGSSLLSRRLNKKLTISL